MLEIRPNCENCGKSLPPNSTEAMICTFECTFCMDCVTKILENVCPNCGGGFQLRPVRPSSLLNKYPASTQIVQKVPDVEKLQQLKDKLKLIPPEER